jgi:hypothetical protein
LVSAEKGIMKNSEIKTDLYIHDFWSWFVKNSNKLESAIYDPLVLKKLDAMILSFGLNWEIGPGVDKKNSLTVSPNGIVELIPVANLFIAKSPDEADWEFYSAKQPKQNWFLLELPNEQISIDASSWEYVLLKYPDNKTEILIKGDTLKQFDKKTQELLVEIVLINLLGEKAYIEQVDYFDIVDKFEQKNGINILEVLTMQLKKLS